MSFHVGRLAKLYLNTGTYGSPVWTEICRVSDVTIGQSKNTATVVTRCSSNQKTVLGSKVFQITFNYLEVLGADTILAALRTSYHADTPAAAKLDVVATNLPIATAGATGIRGMFAVTNFERTEGADDVVSRAVTLDEIDWQETIDSVITNINVGVYTTPSGP